MELRTFEFDNNEELETSVASMIHCKREDAIVVPLYICIDNKRIDIRDYKQIQRAPSSGFKLGFGALNRIFTQNTFPLNLLSEFDIIHQFRQYHSEEDASMGVPTKYIIFESSWVDDIDENRLNSNPSKDIMTQHHVYEQINYYIDLFYHILDEQYKVYRKNIIDNMFDQS